MEGSLLTNVKEFGIYEHFPYICIVKHLKRHKLYAKSNKSKAIS